MDTPTDVYAVLGVAEDADGATLKAAHRRLSKQWHPDRSAHPDAARRMREINHAYDVLRDAARRAEYDRSRAAGPGNPPPSEQSSPPPGPPPAPRVDPVEVILDDLPTSGPTRFTVHLVNDGGDYLGIEIDPPTSGPVEVVSAAEVRGTNGEQVIEFEVSPDRVLSTGTGEPTGLRPGAWSDAVFRVALDGHDTGVYVSLRFQA